MHTTTVRGALRGTTATFAVCAALAAGAASASAAPLALEREQTPITEPEANPVGEEFTSTGSSTISSSVTGTFACLFQRTFSGMKLDC
ncbi:hypothetical protein [Nocardia paucivorans]|uniref:hypothetical protein n=1 Tax=Nocardia paucivorans TaxID=114259 RepID=UPI00030828DD|nr:hypothetical protein [Nocardia paucivorans]